MPEYPYEADNGSTFELFTLADGEKKIEEVPFTAIPNCSDFIIKKEDHTLGNLLSEHAKKHRNVLMAGYKMAHPNVTEVFIRIQTDGTITPKEAFVAVCQKLLRDFTHLSQEFAREWELRRMVNEGEQQNQNGNA